MIDLMLIDDDVPIRDYMRSVIDWGRLGLRLVCEAGDSETARELYLLHRPKIVVTDINIPIISGLELAREFVETDREVRIIVVTGFGNFENVRNSVHLGAIDLLSKPIAAEDLNASLQRAVSHFQDIQRRRRTASAMGELLSENRELLRERCVARLFAGPPEGGAWKIRQQLELLSLNFPGRYFAAVLIQLDPAPADALDGTAFPVALKKLCDVAYTAGGFCAFTFFSAADQLDCLVNWSFESGDERLEAVLSKLLDETQFYLGAGFSACIGSPVEALADLSRSAEQARLAGRFRDGGRIVNYRNIGRLAPACGTFQAPPVEELLACAQRFQRRDFQALLEITCARATLEQHRDLALELLSQLAHVCFQSGVYPWSAVNYPDTIARILNTDQPAQVREILLNACTLLMDTLYQQRSQSKNQLIVLAKDYIASRLSDPELSLEAVSSHIGLSKIYFCQLFHKEEGVSFSAHLNMERVARAKELLRTTSLKIFEISDQVGYRNPKYFNYVFKHATGVTPLEYRRGDRL